MQSEIQNPKSEIFLVGPTAVGKSEIAVELAEQIGAEILNADAFQLYAGLDLLAAKPDAALLRRVRHHLVGAFALSEPMSVARYLEAARAAAAEIRARGRPVVVAGGTGLYVQALIHGLSPGPPSDPDLRRELAALSADTALQRLREVDRPAFDRVDRRNPRRVQRALESALLRVAEPPVTEVLPGILPSPVDAPVGLFLHRDRAELHGRIARRTAEMFRRGVLEEVAAVATSAVGPTAAQMIGWRECVACLRGELSEAEARERIEAATRQYAKRQITWFKRESALERQLLAPADSARVVAGRIAKRMPAIIRSS